MCGNFSMLRRQFTRTCPLNRRPVSEGMAQTIERQGAGKTIKRSPCACTEGEAFRLTVRRQPGTAISGSSLLSLYPIYVRVRVSAGKAAWAPLPSSVRPSSALSAAFPSSALPSSVCLCRTLFFHFHFLSQLAFRTCQKTPDIRSVAIDGESGVKNDQYEQIPAARVEDQNLHNQRRG